MSEDNREHVDRLRAERQTRRVPGGPPLGDESRSPEQRRADRLADVRAATEQDDGDGGTKR